MQTLHGPPILNECQSQPIEQIRIRRQFALITKILLCAYQPLPKKRCPLPIYRHPSRQWMLTGYQPSTQLKPILEFNLR